MTESEPVSVDAPAAPACVVEARTSGPEQTLELGARLAEVLVVGDLVVLSGDLGAGKTRLVKGMGVGLGVADTITSPTFALANRYATNRGQSGQPDVQLHHLDVYRLSVIGEADDLDLADLLETGITVIEWGEQIEAVLPTDRLDVKIEFSRSAVAEGGSITNNEANNITSNITNNITNNITSNEADEGAADNGRRLSVVGRGSTWEQRRGSLTRTLSPWTSTDATAKDDRP